VELGANPTEIVDVSGPRDLVPIRNVPPEIQSIPGGGLFRLCPLEGSSGLVPVA
jgi:hypothetical protein